MSHLRHVIKSPTTTLLRRNTLRHFSVDSSVDTLLQDSPGWVYGKLRGIERHTLKSDIINYFDGINLTNHDLKLSYNANFAPIEMLMRFPSFNEYGNALRKSARKGRIFRLEKAVPSEWDILIPYDGKTVLLLGLSQNVVFEDIERFLAGCGPYSGDLLNRAGGFKLALAHFPSRIAATNAFIARNRGFCLNNQVTMRVLE